MRLTFEDEAEKALFARRVSCASGASDRELIAAAERYFTDTPQRPANNRPAPPRLTARQFEHLQERLNDPWDTLYAGVSFDDDSDDPNYYGKG